MCVRIFKIMKITESQLRSIIREELENLNDTPITWEKDEDSLDSHFYETKNGVYEWHPMTGYLTFMSFKNGRRTVLSKEISPKRSGGFHNAMRDQKIADELVRNHMKRVRN